MLDITHIDRPREEAEDSKKKEVFEEVPHPTISPLQDGPLKNYYEGLHPHDIFKEYREETTVVVNFGLSYSRRSVFVIHVNQPYKGVRLPFHLSRITTVDGTLNYEHIGAYTSENWAEWRLLKLKDDVSNP